jgi:hypothetical protein
MPFISSFLTAVGTAIGFAAGSTGLATFLTVGKAVLGFGLNFVVGKIAQRFAKKDTKTASGVQFDREYGENVSRKVACGLVGIAGHDCYVNTYGSSNKELQQIYVLSDYPCDGLSRIFAGGSLLSLEFLSGESDSTLSTYRVSSGDYSGLMKFYFYSGTQTGADGQLVANSNPSGRWTSAHVGLGMCYLIVAMTYDQDKNSTFPDFFFEIRGARLYDVRKDSTAGGSGSHRWGDYSTHEFSQNPIVMDYNYRRGFTWNDDLFLGMGMEPDDLPVAQYATAMNICDETVSGEARYRCSVLLDADVEHGDNIDALMTACGGIVVDGVDGSWPIIGTDQPIVATFTDDDLVTGEAVTFQRRRSMAELVNSVGGTYPEPSNLWSPAGYDTQTSASYVGLDRRTRDFQVNFDMVSSKRQANQLASIYFNENRFEATASVVLRPYFQDIKIGDWVEWQSARYGTRTYAVTSRSIRALTSDGPRNVSLSLQERDGSIYAGAGVIAPVVPVPNGQPVYLSELQDWAVIPVLSVASNGLTIPAFRMSWAPIVDATVTAIDFQWWLADAPENVFSKRVTARENIGFVQEGIMSLQDFVFRHILVAPGRLTNWSDEVEVTALDGGNSDIEVYLGNLQEEVKDLFEGLSASLDDTRTLLERVLTDTQLANATSEIARRKLSTEIGNSRAEYLEEISVVSSETSAAVEALETLTAAVEDSSVQGRVSFALAANQAGVDARFAVLIRATTADAYKETGFFLELYTTGGVQRTRFAVLADQFVVTDGSAYTLPLVYEAGVLTLEGVRVKWADIENAVIDNLIVGTSNIEPGAVTKVAVGTTSVTLDHGFGSPPVRLDISFFAIGNNYTGCTVRNDTDAVNLDVFTVDGTASTNRLAGAITRVYLIYPPSGRSNTTFSLNVSTAGALIISGRVMIAQAFKV